MDSSLIIAVAVIITLAVTFMVSFVLYHKAPTPPGCEDVKITPENCKNCPKEDCKNHPHEDKKEENK